MANTDMTLSVIVWISERQSLNAISVYCVNLRKAISQRCFSLSWGLTLERAIGKRCAWKRDKRYLAMHVLSFGHSFGVEVRKWMKRDWRRKGNRSSGKTAVPTKIHSYVVEREYR